MSIATMPNTLGDVLKREFDHDYTRETVPVEARAEGYPLGAVLGRKNSTGIYCMAIAEAMEATEAVDASEGVAPSDGEEVACVVLLQNIEPDVEISDAVVLARGPAIVAEAGLVFDDSVNTDALKYAKHQQLAQHGIVVRQSV